MFVASGVMKYELEREGRRLVRRDGKQVLLISSEGRLFAIANRCPHEGYPLSEGTLGPGCVLTCNWHNWKYDLQSGAALVGRDPVRTYPVAIKGDEIHLDLSDPPAEAQRDRALKGIEAGMADNDGARIAREAARLERAGFDVRQAIAHAIVFSNDRLENGMTHAHAAGADWLALADEAPDDDARLAALLEPIGHLAWDTTGAGTFPYAGKVARWDEAKFLGAMEDENEGDVIARIRGAIDERIPYCALRPVLGEAALAHYADFGHSAIYALKAGQLIERVGDEACAPVLLAHVRQLVQARREERLPEFRHYPIARKEWNSSGKARLASADLEGLPVEKCLRKLSDASGRNTRELYDALLGAAAWNLLHFNLDFDRATNNQIADNVGWLDFTHALTFANAARHLSSDRPRLWPNTLLQLALFVGRNAGYVDAGQDVAEWRVNDTNAFLAREKSRLFDHGIVEPIVACHRLKVLFALDDELQQAPDAPWAPIMCAAVNRYLNTPMKRHHGLRLAAQARDFIAREG
jgi:nitrite reductase/ring-hydroxylating ferredoxin subunit